MLTLKVIVVSTRPGRRGKVIGDWFMDYAHQHGSFDKVDLVDLAEVNLPLFDEPNHPSSGDYVHEHTKQWSEIINEGDAFVLVLPEYNYFVPPGIINAIDYLHHEWKYKPAAAVSYGGISGGIRSWQALKPLLANLSIMPINPSVTLQGFTQYIDEASGIFKPSDIHTEAADRMLVELKKWAIALQDLRAKNQ
jgi:NAD(P)H-dependent FMN reductase